MAATGPVLKQRQTERMSNPQSFLRRLTKRSPATVAGFAVVLLVGLVVPAAAQFFPFGQQSWPRQRQYEPQPQRPPFGGFFAPFEQPPPRQAPPPRVDYSRAPPPEKPDTPPERNILVLGDAMADWLGYGLEQALSETPDLGVIRKHKTVSGLIRYQPKGEPSDWAAAAKGIVATEPADAIVVMLGLSDRIPIREPAADSKAAEKKKAEAGKAAGAKPEGAGDAAKTKSEAKTDDKAAAAEQAPDDEQPSIVAPEKGARAANGVYEFREDRWVELYTRKIDEMIAVLKSKGVPVVWVGLPAVRGTKATSDMLFLDTLYRESAAKAGITYVDVWDGFVDDAGRFLQQGPDFEGQTRRLRSADGVYFTKAGARKLAHYVDREIRRLLANRTLSIAVPSEPVAPEAEAAPGEPPPRPLAGPVLPLVASTVGTSELLGGPGTRPAAVDALAARTMVKGEPLPPIAGRADDYVWPRREPGKMASIATPVATASVADDDDRVASRAKPVVKRPRQRRVPSEPQQARVQSQQQDWFANPFGGWTRGRPAPPPPRGGPPPSSRSGFFSNFFGR
jgi:hypothetical protein